MVKTFLVIGENANIGEKVLFSGSKSDCIDWIWYNCDIGDLEKGLCHTWSGFAYYEENNFCFRILVNKFYN